MLNSINWRLQYSYDALYRLNRCALSLHFMGTCAYIMQAWTAARHARGFLWSISNTRINLGVHHSFAEYLPVSAQFLLINAAYEVLWGLLSHSKRMYWGHWHASTKFKLLQQIISDIRRMCNLSLHHINVLKYWIHSGGSAVQWHDHAAYRRIVLYACPPHGCICRQDPSLESRNECEKLHVMHIGHLGHPLCTSIRTLLNIFLLFLYLVIKCSVWVIRGTVSHAKRMYWAPSARIECIQVIGITYKIKLTCVTFDVSDQGDVSDVEYTHFRLQYSRCIVSYKIALSLHLVGAYA